MAIDFYKLTKENYDNGNYLIDQLRIFVEKGKITPAQFQMITEEKYES
jgi:hypothetical protein